MPEIAGGDFDPGQRMLELSACVLMRPDHRLGSTGWSEMLNYDQLKSIPLAAIVLVNICDAKARLSALLDKAIAGEEIVIARAGKPLARLMPVSGAASKSGVRLGGLKRAKLKLAADFHQAMSDDDLLRK